MLSSSRGQPRGPTEVTISIKLLVGIIVFANVAYHACESLFTRYVLPWF